MEADDLRLQLEAELAALDDDQSNVGDDDDFFDVYQASLGEGGADGRGGAAGGDTGADASESDWDDLMNSVRTMTERFQVVEESLAIDDRPPAPLAAPRPLTEDPSPCVVYAVVDRESEEWKHVRALMDRMIDSIELSAPATRTEAAAPLEVPPINLLALPQLIIDESEFVVPAASARNHEGSSTLLHAMNDKVDDEEARRLQRIKAAEQELEEAEERLRREAEAAARSADEKKRQRLEKRQQMEKELHEIATGKVALAAQRLWRGHRARTLAKTVLAEVQVSRAAAAAVAAAAAAEVARAEEETRRRQLAEEEEKQRETARREMAERAARERAEEEERQAQARREEEARARMEEEKEEERVREQAEGAAMAAMDLCSSLLRAHYNAAAEKEDEVYDFDYGSDAEDAEDDMCSDADADADGGADRADPKHAATTTFAHRVVVEAWAVRPPAPVKVLSDTEKGAAGARVEGTLAHWADLVGHSSREAATHLDRCREVVASAAPVLAPSFSSSSLSSALSATMFGDPSAATRHASYAPEDALTQALRCYKSFETRTSVTKRLSALRRLAGVNGKKDAHGAKSLDASIRGTKTAAPPALTAQEQEQLYSFGLRSPDEMSPEIYRDISLCVESMAECSFLRVFAPTLRSLQLNVNKLRNLRGLEHMAALEDLSAIDNAISDTAALSGLTALRSLRLGDNHLTADTVAATLSGLPRLLTLSLNTNKLTSLPVLTGCDALQRLEVYHNGITAVSAESLRALKSLTHLDLGRNKLDHVSGEALSQCPLLQTLVLSQNVLTSPPAPLYLPNLRTLWLSSNRIASLDDWLPRVGADGATSTSWPVFLPMLDKLLMQDNALSEVPPAAVCNLPLLDHLDVSFNALAAIDPPLRGLEHLPVLRVLNLHDNPVYAAHVGENRAGSQASDLHKYLVKACPSLKILSGAALPACEPSAPVAPASAPSHAPSRATSHHVVVAAVSAENVWEAHGHEFFPAAASAAAARSADADVPQLDADGLAKAKRLQDMLTEYRQHKAAASGGRPRFPRFPRFSEPPVLHRRLDAKGVQPVSDATGGARLSNCSPQSRALIELLSAASTEQSVLRAREKNDAKKADGVPNVAIDPTAALAAAAAAEPPTSWELLLTQQMLEHCETLLGWSQAGPGNARIVGMKAAAAAGVPGAVALLSLEDLFAADPAPPADDAPAAPLVADDTPPADAPTAAATVVAAVTPTPPPTASPAVARGVARAQAVWRGGRLRRQIQGILAASRYCDDELDALLMGAGGAGDEASVDALEALGMGFDAYDDLLGPVSLRDDWQRPYGSASAAAPAAAAAADGDGADDDCDDERRSLSAPFVYGDHRRRGSFVNHRAGSRETESNAATPQKRDAAGAGAGEGWADGAAWRGTPSRPSTSFTDTSSISASSRAQSEPDDEAHSLLSLRSASAQRPADGAGIAEMYSARDGARPSAADATAGGPLGFSPSKSRADALGEEWGITDPKVLQAILKRNKRMKSFATAKEARERDKDPNVRLQKFMKNSFKAGGGPMSPPPAGGGSGRGGGGGAGSHMGSGRGRGGRFGHGGRRTVVMPAWAVGGGDEEHDV